MTCLSHTTSEHHHTVLPHIVQFLAQTAYVMRCSSQSYEVRKTSISPTHIPPEGDANGNWRHRKTFLQHPRKCFKNFAGWSGTHEETYVFGRL